MITDQEIIETYKVALEKIEKLGHSYGHGYGYTCANIAKEALDKVISKLRIM